MKLKLEDFGYARCFIYESKKYYVVFNIDSQFIAINKESDKNLNNGYEMVFSHDISGKRHNKKTQIDLLIYANKKKNRTFEK